MPASTADYDQLDTARWLAALAVVLLHCAAVPLTRALDHGSVDWQWANVYDAATRWCVPVFVMISGVLLLNPDKQESVKRFYLRRARRILPATLFWTVFYLLWGALMYHLQGTAMDTAAWLRKATSGEPYYHLWYLYMLIGLYLVAPWLRLLYRRTSRRQRFAVLTLVFTLAILQSLHREANSHGYGFFLFWFLPYISYFWAGRMLFDGQLRLAAPVLWLITAVALTAIGTNILSTFETLNLYFYDNFSVTVPLMSLAIFQLLLHTRRLPRLSVIAPLTFGVYLVHPVFLDIATQSGLYGSGSGIVWQAPLIAVLIFILSLAFVGLLRRLPGGTRFS